MLDWTYNPFHFWRYMGLWDKAQTVFWTSVLVIMFLILLWLLWENLKHALRQ